jgi:Zn-dependent protease
MENLKFAVYLAVALVPSLVLHEYAHGFAAGKLGDPTPRRWGRLTLNPRPLVDPFGSVILPALLLILVASGQGCLLPVFAYAKPIPLDPNYLRHRDRDTTLIALAGPAANVVLAAIAGAAYRVGLTGEVALFVEAFLIVNVFMCVFQLMPVPGFDGARILARFLPPRPRQVFVNLDQYQVLFVLVVFFLLAGPFIAIVRAIANALFGLLAGVSYC